MKKQLPKPENWQDFESLCKKLWGELWEIPDRIKKNGRLGQPQNGVDIYGIPKNKTQYWGVQCKGKDEYIHAKLTEREVDQEIEKAKKFNPGLEAFIIATTSNKDAKIEEYVRLKDIENRKNKGFGIILFCWEDIVDLIEDNRSTFQFYVNDKQFIEKYGFDIAFDNDEHETTLKPKYYRKIKKWQLKKGNERNLMYRLPGLHRNGILDRQMNWYGRTFDNTNTAICEIKIKLKNTGNVVLENWFVTFQIIGEHKPINEARFQSRGLPNFGFNTKERKILSKNVIKYSNDYPLVQESEENFEIELIPLPHNYELKLEWELKARDFQKNGVLKLAIEPVFEDEIDYVFVNDELDLKEIEVISVRENIYEKDEDKKEEGYVTLHRGNM